MPCHSLRRCHGWCRCSDDLEPRRLLPHVETAPLLDGRRLSPPAGISKPQIGRGGYLRPCTPRPSHPRPAFPECGNAKWFDQSKIGIPSFPVILGCVPEASQRSDTSNYCNFAYSALASFTMGTSGSASLQIVRKS